MTTGEKLAKLRREHNYTQEQLAEIIGVSRQSISKWESDGAFPETEKLIQLSRMYNCSIDYLLKEEIEEKLIPNSIENSISKNNSLKKFLTKNLYTLLWSLGYFILMLLIYLMPCVILNVDNLIVKINFYGLLNSRYNYSSDYILILNFRYYLSNYVLLLTFLIEFSIIVISILIYCINNNKKLYLIRIMLSIIVLLGYIFLFIKYFKHIGIGLILITILSIGNVLGLIFLKFNKFKEPDYE